MASKYTQELLEPLLLKSRSMADLLARLGLKPTGGNYRHINQRLKALNLDKSHFKGQGWAQGKTKETDEGVAKSAKGIRTPDREVFIRNSSYSTHHLARRLKQLGWKYRCKECGLTKWQGKTLTLHVDHINGDHSDHRLENLRFLCPNCHQQTRTWGNGPVGELVYPAGLGPVPHGVLVRVQAGSPELEMIGDCIAQCIECIRQGKDGYTCTCGKEAYIMDYARIQETKRQAQG